MSFFLFDPSKQQHHHRTLNVATPFSALDIGAGMAVALFGVQFLTSADPIGRTLKFMEQLSYHEKRLSGAENVEKSVTEYNRLHSQDESKERYSEYKSLVNSYYDLATLFYEVGWGPSFHFANRYHDESFEESIRRHEYYLASKLQLTGGGSQVKVLDVGCGIGGPLRNISRFTGADVTGITLNQYQVDRGNDLCEKDPIVGPSKLGRLTQGDFMNMPFEDSAFDGAYAIEATCHAPDRVKCYHEIYRCLKPGAIFACYEWCMTDNYDPSDPIHKKIKKRIEEGDGLPDIVHWKHCLESMKKAGFEILEERDMANDNFALSRGGQPWMLPLLPGWNPLSQRFQFNWLGLILTEYGLKLLELLYLAPKGTSQTQILLQSGGMGLGQGGKLKIFTPMYLMVGRVPLNKDALSEGQ